MYEDLVKRLRDDEAWKNCDFDFIYGWMHEAADAIEELISTVASLRKRIDRMKSDASWDEDIRRGQVQGMW